MRAVSTVIALAAAGCFCCHSVGAEPRIRVPQRFKQLYRKGNMKVEFYDPETDPMEYEGHASFQLEARTRFNYKYRFVTRGGKRYIRITPQVVAFDWEIRHVVKIPKSHNNDGLWDGKLMLHELDHVATSTDPRAKMLLEHLLRSIKTVEKPFKRRGKVEPAEIEKLVDEELNARRDALVELIKHVNRDLDRKTVHGVKPLSDRDAFFKSLYTKEGLDHYGFPYIGEALELFERKDYRNAKLLHHSGAKNQRSPIEDSNPPQRATSTRNLVPGKTAQ